MPSCSRPISIWMRFGREALVAALLGRAAALVLLAGLLWPAGSTVPDAADSVPALAAASSLAWASASFRSLRFSRLSALRTRRSKNSMGTQRPFHSSASASAMRRHSSSVGATGSGPSGRAQLSNSSFIQAGTRGTLAIHSKRRRRARLLTQASTGLGYLPRVAPQIAVIAGDGVGKEVVPEGIKVLGSLGLELEFEQFPWGCEH